MTHWRRDPLAHVVQPQIERDLKPFKLFVMALALALICAAATVAWRAL